MELTVRLVFAPKLCEFDLQFGNLTVVVVVRTEAVDLLLEIVCTLSELLVLPLRLVERRQGVRHQVLVETLREGIDQCLEPPVCVDTRPICDAKVVVPLRVVDLTPTNLKQLLDRLTFFKIEFAVETRSVELVHDTLEVHVCEESRRDTVVGFVCL